MGSGTTGLACVSMDREFIGIEREQKYFDIACKRIEKEWSRKQSEIQFEPVKPPRQLSLIESHQ